MGSKTYKTRTLILKKTKLSDKDLIVTMLAEDGSLLKGVAKGARKPGGSFAARLELFSTVDVMMAQGRSLDVVCEARLVRPASATGASLDYSACASPLAELLGLVAQPGLEQQRLFDMADAAFARIDACAKEPAKALSITAAGIWKVLGQTGFRPSIASCALCANPVAFASAGVVVFSPMEGGVVCPACQRPADAIAVDVDTARWCETLIRLRYDDILDLDIDLTSSFAVLSLAKTWIRTHLGRSLKSLDFLFTSGLF